jgi:hypothetical protein
MRGEQRSDPEIEHHIRRFRGSQRSLHPDHTSSCYREAPDLKEAEARRISDLCIRRPVSSFIHGLRDAYATRACTAGVISLIFRIKSYGTKDLTVDSIPSITAQ